MKTRGHPALTIWRPWTTCILRHGKTTENRGWETSHRGPIWIHAGKRFDNDALTFAAQLGITLSRFPVDHPMGIVAQADLVDVLDCQLGGGTCQCGPWAVRWEYHWQLTNVRELTTPIACNGAQGLWYPAAGLTDTAAFREAAP